MAEILNQYGPQFLAEYGILNLAVDFAHFRGISTFSRNSVLTGDKGDKYGIFWSGLGGLRTLIAICRHDCTMQYMTALKL